MRDNLSLTGVFITGAVMVIVWIVMLPILNSKLSKAAEIAGKEEYKKWEDDNYTI